KVTSSTIGQRIGSTTRQTDDAIGTQTSQRENFTIDLAGDLGRYSAECVVAVGMLTIKSAIGTRTIDAGASAGLPEENNASGVQARDPAARSQEEAVSKGTEVAFGKRRPRGRPFQCMKMLSERRKSGSGRQQLPVLGQNDCIDGVNGAIRRDEIRLRDAGPID